MSDDRDPPSDGPGWDPETSLFGFQERPERLRPASGQQGESSPPLGDEALRGPLFGERASSAESDSPQASGSPLDPESWGAREADSARSADTGEQTARHAESGSGASDESLWPRSEPRSDTEKKKKKGKSSGSFFRELPVLLLIAFVLAFLLRTFVLQVFYIPSSSMEPTLQINDRMVVEKVSYQFRDPQRGEIVVFEGEDLGRVDPELDLVSRTLRGVGQFLGVVPASARDFVKRVIGLPGDEILIEGGQVFVNDEPLEEPYVEFEDPSDYGPVTVPEDSLFFLGDNRPNSSDSRRSMGFVPMDQVVGRSVVVIWPPDHMGSLTGVEYEVPSD